ncbi:hypothetical protein [Streptomyces sp. NPDC005336]|uniref:hypothetical protein n=1 Tax=unclassified Streptomyces TaxID=2593676 RepID=UPI0033BCDF01
MARSLKAVLFARNDTHQKGLAGWSNTLRLCFLADTLCLDFLNSIATPVDTQINWLEDGEASWPGWSGRA